MSTDIVIDTRSGRNNGLHSETKFGANVLGTSAEGGFEGQLHYVPDIYSTGTKTVTKLGGMLADSDFKPNSSKIGISKGVGSSMSSTQVTESQYGTETKYTENSFTIGWKAIVGVELKFTY